MFSLHGVRADVLVARSQHQPRNPCLIHQSHRCIYDYVARSHIFFVAHVASPQESRHESSNIRKQSVYIQRTRHVRSSIAGQTF
jgi:hypothetical protein